MGSSQRSSKTPKALVTAETEAHDWTEHVTQHALMAEISSETKVEIYSNPFTSLCLNISNNLGKENRLLEHNVTLKNTTNKLTRLS